MLLTKEIKQRLVTAVVSETFREKREASNQAAYLLTDRLYDTCITEHQKAMIEKAPEAFPTSTNLTVIFGVESVCIPMREKRSLFSLRSLHIPEKEVSAVREWAHGSKQWHNNAYQYALGLTDLLKVYSRLEDLLAEQDEFTIAIAELINETT